MFSRVDGKLLLVLDIDAEVGPLFDLEPFLLILSEQVANLLVVNFEISDADEKSIVFLLLLRNVTENVRERVWNDALQLRITPDSLN